MAEPSAYLTRLQWLKKLLNGDSSPEPTFNSELSERLRLLSILIAVQDTIRYFQDETVKADESILLHIDEDINYLEWTNAEWMVNYNWMCSDEPIVKEQLSNAWKANIDPQVTDKQADNLADYLPNSVISSFNATGGKQTLSQYFQVLAGPYYNTSNLQMAVYQAVLTLTETLKNLKKALTKDRTEEEYEAMMLAQWTAYNTVRNGEAMRIKLEYETEKDELSEPMSLDWLNSRRTRAVNDFLESEFLTAKMEECGLDSNKSLARLCTIKDGIYMFDKNVSVGRFICKKRISQRHMEQFFAFRKRVELIQADMQALREELHDIFPQEMDFSHSVFNDNHDIRRIYNKLYDLVHQKKLLTSKKQWYIIFIVFKEKGWLKSNTSTSFCKDINMVFANYSSDIIWKPNSEDFKKVEAYYKNHPFIQWNKEDRDAPQTCADYKYIADTINSIFGSSYLRPST